MHHVKHVLQGALIIFQFSNTPAEDLGGVYMVFNGNVINGYRAVKVRIKSSNAFDSINYPFVATIEGNSHKYNLHYSFPQKIRKLNILLLLLTMSFC